jgi:hypothetical protein
MITSLHDNNGNNDNVDANDGDHFDDYNNCVANNVNQL